MPDLPETLDLPWSHGASLWLMEIWLRGLILSAVLALMWPLLRPATAALRYFMRAAVFFGLVALPLLELALPAWHVLPLSILTSQERCLEVLESAVVVGPWTLTVAQVIGGGWALIAGLFLLRMVFWMTDLRRLSLRAFPVDSGPIYEAFHLARIRLGLKQSAVTLYVTKLNVLPMTWGFRRCSIVVPEEAMGWPYSQRLSVFLHELAHVRRRDCLMAAVEQIACALHWFNPLAWLAANANHMDREYACDDVVLRSGVKASDYAQHLLRSATQKLSPAPTLVARFTSRKRPLRRRIDAVLKAKAPRRRLNWLEAFSALMVVGVFVVPVALLEPREAGPGPESRFVDLELTSPSLEIASPN